MGKELAEAHWLLVSIWTTVHTNTNAEQKHTIYRLALHTLRYTTSHYTTRALHMRSQASSATIPPAVNKYTDDERQECKG